MYNCAAFKEPAAGPKRDNNPIRETVAVVCLTFAEVDSDTAEHSAISRERVAEPLYGEGCCKVSNLKVFSILLECHIA